MKRFAKALLSVVLTAALLLSLQAAPAEAWAAELKRPKTVTATSSHTNPMYAPPEFRTEADAPATAYTAEVGESAVETLRNALKTRAATATIRFAVDATYDPENPDAFWLVAETVEEGIFADAVAHTGDPTEGDYIRCNYYGRKMHFSASLGTVATITVDYEFTYHANAAQEQAVDSRVAQLLAELDVSAASDYEKVCAVYDWLCNNVRYSDPIQPAPSTDYSAYGALVEEDCVCQGYAAAYYRLLLELGVDCRVISGTDGDGDGHAWNIVRLGGVYYNADATWDTSWLEAGLPYEWFLRCDANFPDHIRDPELATESFYVAYPMAQKDYEPPISGTCGDNLTWMLDNTGLLTISGTGEMTEAPWLTEYAGSITAVHMEPGITSLCKSAFTDCDALTEVVIPEGVTAIPLDTFAGCYLLSSVTIPSTVTKIDQCAFLSCPSLKSFVFPEGIGIVEFELFMNCYSLESVTIPTSVGVIKACAFQDCDSLGDITIPDCVFSIGDYAFYKSGITALKVGPGDAVDRTLGANTLPAIPDGIGRYSFADCYDLAEVEFTPEIREIGEYAFRYCENLTKGTFLGDAPTISSNAFMDVTATMYYPAGNPTWTEAVMQDYGGDITWVSYEKETEPFALSGTSVSLGDSLDMHFFVDPSYVDANCHAELIRYYSDGRGDDIVTVPYSSWNTLDDGRLYITYGNIAAKEMGDYVTVEIFNGSGEAISQLYVDSVKSYATRMLDKAEVVANEELRTLYVDMLNYGAAAQAQFGYNVTMPANDLLTEEQLAWATDSYETESNLVSGTGRAGTALTLKSRITLDFIFNNTAIGSDYTGLYAVATYVDHYGDAVQTRIDTVKAFGEEMSYVSVPGLAVADYGQAVTCRIYNAQGELLAWATDSMEGYAHRMAGTLPDVVEAIVKFGTSSYSFFH